ncbi:Fat-like cadherin-related tumor suppressor homolog [Geodia barretti]|nr:Fat-like cadherin-related tumor suppressor homolog [Geodia barretti]
MGTLWHNVVAVLVAALLQSVAVTGNFQLEVQVVRVRDSVDDCGWWPEVCDLYIDEMCLDPQFEEPGSEEEDQDCSLIEYENNLDLESGLPKTRTLSVTNQPWPVDFHLRIEVMDIDTFNNDDHIEDVVVSESLNTSSEFSEEMDYRNTPNGRITLSMRFRVRCSGEYEGPHCDCLPHNDGHYSCREDGGISCLPGYTNTSNLCRQQDYCVGEVCPSEETCVSNPTSYTCEPPPTSPATVSPTTSPTITVSRDNCNCATGMKCIEEDGGYRCVCPEGENCSTPGPSTAAPRQQSGETSSSMPPAVIGAIVAGLLVALLLCAVVVIAVVVCILMRKRRWSKLAPKTNGRGRRGPT